MFQPFCGGECGGEMSKKKLTTQLLNSNLKAGRHYDDSGNGLHIYVRKSGSKSWSQKIRYNGKQLELGLGNYPAVPLAEARRIAAENKSSASKGINPKFKRTKPKAIPTFSEVTEEALPTLTEGLSNQKNIAQWRTTLEAYAHPHVGNMPVDKITVNHIHDLLKQIWKDKTETAAEFGGALRKCWIMQL